MTNIKDPKNDKWRRIVANFISAINTPGLDDKNTSSPSLWAEFFLSGRLLVAGAPVADWGGVSTWGQEGLSCHPPPATARPRAWWCPPSPRWSFGLFAPLVPRLIIWGCQNAEEVDQVRLQMRFILALWHNFTVWPSFHPEKLHNQVVKKLGAYFDIKGAREPVVNRGAWLSRRCVLSLLPMPACSQDTPRGSHTSCAMASIIEMYDRGEGQRQLGESAK